MGDVRGRLFVPSPRGRSYAEINEWLMDRCVEDAKKHPHPTIPGKRRCARYSSDLRVTVVIFGTLTVAQGRVGPPSI